MNATPAIMDFFNKWTLKTTPGGRAASPPSKAPSAPAICPSQNGETYKSDHNKSFKISCSADTPSTPAYTGATKPGSFAACIKQCAGETQCGHAVFYNDKCWKKKGRPAKVAKARTNARVAVKN